MYPSHLIKPGAGFSLVSLLAILALAGNPASPAFAAITQQTGNNFTAATLFTDASLVPPDSDGAIGPNYFVELINGRFSVFDKISGAKVQTMTDLTFWNNAGITFPSGTTASDPRIIYDPLSGRWFATQIDFIPSNQFSNRFLLAISASADPTGSWNGLAWLADPGGTFADFPRLGIDARGVYLTGNQFNQAGNFVGTLITSIPKADLLLATPTATNRTTSGLIPNLADGFSLQPIVNFNGTNDAEVVIATENDGTDFIAHSNLISFKVQNADTSAATFSTPTNIPVPGYSVPIDPYQPDGQKDLDDGDVRIGSYVFQLGDVIYAVHGIEIGPRAALRWYRLRASDQTLLEAGTISDTNLDLFYPSIAANTNGFVVIAFNGSSTNTFVSSFAVAGRTINGTTVFGPTTLLASGTANYELNVGDVRWGDYSTTTVDWSQPDHFWTIQEIPLAPNRWSTQVTEMIVAETPPVLKIVRTGNTAQLSWSTNDIGFTLQSGTNLAPTIVWSDVTNAVFVLGNQNTVSVTTSNAAQFFRLMR